MYIIFDRHNKVNFEVDLQTAYRYASIGYGVKDAETFIFDNPCDRCPGYVIYAIYNYDGIIMVDTILNANKNKGIHSITSKGTESLNMYDAMVRYYLGKGTSEINPNNNRKNVYIGV